MTHDRTRTPWEGLTSKRKTKQTGLRGRVTDAQRSSKRKGRNETQDKETENKKHVRTDTAGKRRTTERQTKWTERNCLVNNARSGEKNCKMNWNVERDTFNTQQEDGKECGKPSKQRAVRRGTTMLPDGSNNCNQTN